MALAISLKTAWKNPGTSPAAENSANPVRARTSRTSIRRTISVRAPARMARTSRVWRGLCMEAIRVPSHAMLFGGESSSRRGPIIPAGPPDAQAGGRGRDGKGWTGADERYAPAVRAPAAFDERSSVRPLFREAMAARRLACRSDWQHRWCRKDCGERKETVAQKESPAGCPAGLSQCAYCCGRR